MFKKILIPNRGEIAVRIIKACSELGIKSAVVYSQFDKNSLHVRTADEAYCIMSDKPNEAYLNHSKIIELAIKIKADAIHPGYGFLSENAKFIESLEKTGISFIGPTSHSVKIMGNKTEARKLMSMHGVPIVPGSLEAVKNLEEAVEIGESIGYPIMLKASAGGGGKGMRLVKNRDELESSFENASNEVEKAFGSRDVFIEKYILNPKHIEVQILADQQGNTVHLFERECSIQRRHQKIIEESPSPSIDDNTRKKLTQAAVKAAKISGYRNAGTIEFLVDSGMNFYFLEMNTRLQVEHPVTEAVTGIDIVKEQIKIAAGNKLSYRQNQIKINAHALECRICSEDGNRDFSPSTGKILHHRMPSGAGIRIDRGIDLHSDITIYYDSLLSKVITWGKDRGEALARMKRALNEYQIAGVVTNIPVCKWILKHNKFIDASYSINFINDEFQPNTPDKWQQNTPEEYVRAASVLAAIIKRKRITFVPAANCHTNWSRIEENE